VSFATDPLMLDTIAALMKSTGLTPLQILQMEPVDLSLSLLIVQHHESRQAEIMRSLNRSGSPVFPVAIVRG
jgi:hypothetical protein